MKISWKSFEAVENPPQWIHPNERDMCYYAMDYTPDAPWSDFAKSKIKNFKKNPHSCSQIELEYKREAINYFSRFVVWTFKKGFLQENDEEFIILNMPSSIPQDSRSYDDRFEKLAQYVIRQTDHIHFPCPIGIINDIGHTRETNQRNPESLKRNYQWDGFNMDLSNIGAIFILDDNITSGSHFRAYKDFLSANYDCNSTEIYGLFFTRTNRALDFEL